MIMLMINSKEKHREHVREKIGQNVEQLALAVNFYSSLCSNV